MMGRTDGKLSPYLREGLENESFGNLKWLDRNSQIFCLTLPRYEKKKDLKDYEGILVNWYVKNKRKYPGYSGAKAVLQAALRKSVFLVSLRSKGNELHFRFATEDEIKEKRRRQKEQSSLVIPNKLHKAYDLHSLYKESNMPIKYELSLYSPNRPPSTSSGYQSGTEDLDENVEVFNESILSEDHNLDIFMNPEKYLKQDIFLSGMFGDTEESVPMDSIIENGVESVPVDSIIENSMESVPMDSIIGNGESVPLASTIKSGMENVPLDVTGGNSDYSVSLDAIFGNSEEGISLDALLGNNEKSAPPNTVIENSEKCIPLDAVIGNTDASVPLDAVIENCEKSVSLDDFKLNGLQLMQPFNEAMQDLVKPVIELTTTVVNSSENLKTYWLCTRKLFIDSTLLLICEKQVIQNGSKEFLPGHFYLNNVFKPGELYKLKQMFEVDEKYFLFLSLNN